MDLSFEEYKTLVDQSQIMIWRSNTDTLCDYFNSAWLDFTGKSFEEELGHGWSEGVHPDDFDRCLKIYTDNFKNEKDFVMEYRLLRADGEYRWIYDKGVPFYDNHGVFQGYIGSCFDIHETYLYQNEIQKRNAEKDVLLKEIHHRVKNNLQLITSLMYLQSSKVKNAKLNALYKETELRIKAIALVHERLYKSENMYELDFDVYLKNLVSDLLFSINFEHNIDLEFYCPPLKLDLNIAVPLGILVNEIITNAIKYGIVDNDDPQIRVILNEYDTGKYLLEIGDNGNGIPNFNLMDSQETLGINLICELASQLDGQIDIDNSRKGVNYQLSF